MPITPAICSRAMVLIDAPALSHGLRLPDALIAATAVEHGATLLTGNAKYFGAVPDLALEVFAA